MRINILWYETWNSLLNQHVGYFPLVSSVTIRRNLIGLPLLRKVNNSDRWMRRAWEWRQASHLALDYCRTVSFRRRLTLRRIHHRGNTSSAQLAPVTLVWNGNLHLVCPCPTQAGLMTAGGRLGAYQTISPLFSAAFDGTFTRLWTV